ncbi:alpha-L-iduronidase [Aplysia californica]|uniref:Alpha-L-iduronidase n=1 Tax=Aplysia californica TaxID=6500 RepID=A0ABM1VPU9_APLCA|nr:alpha-L-iduronidase [Aplysia californica]XP_035824441.1 alpha-L-iduronidase [Aplysia californica]XP_035824442.1 alpha-L-iduronidase [Aplysia californica]
MKSLFGLPLLLIICLFKDIDGVEGGFEFKISLNSTDVRGPLDHFWRSTGFCPPKPHNDSAKFDLGPDMQQNLAYIGAVPWGGIRQVRVHWLFDLVTVNRITGQGPDFNFSNLDKLIALMHQNGLYLGFELMGNPSGIFLDMENKTQVYWWRDLVAATARRYVDQYGSSYVRGWNFETWNEPDCHDFDQNKMTVQGFLNYYDACSEGLDMVDNSLTFGGPGDGCGLYLDGNSTQYGDALFNHVIRGTNYFTGEKGVRMDFISMHEKGDSKGINVLKKETVAVNLLKARHPELEKKPFYNDEADPLVGWSKPELWRANAVYASLVVKIISQHQNILKARPDPVIQNYQLLSNDNGFLSYYPNQFTQRTLLARFQMNNTASNYVTFVRKPVYIVMGMLALLRETQVHVDTSQSNTSDFGVLATLHEHIMKNSSDSWQMTLIVFGASDPGEPTDYAMLNLNWYISPPEGTTSLKLMTQLCYNGAANPYDVWAGLYNKTAFPTLKQFAYIRTQEDPYPELMDVPVKPGIVPIPPRFQILDPHIVVLHLCAKSDLPPEKVMGVRFLNVTEGQMMVIWSDDNIHTKCLLTYEVEVSTSGPSGPYRRVNKNNSVVTLFLFETDSEEKVRGHYRVRAVDYWHRGGDFSSPLLYS